MNMSPPLATAVPFPPQPTAPIAGGGEYNLRSNIRTEISEDQIEALISQGFTRGMSRDCANRIGRTSIDPCTVGHAEAVVTNGVACVNNCSQLSCMRAFSKSMTNLRFLSPPTNRSCYIIITQQPNLSAPNLGC